MAETVEKPEKVTEKPEKVTEKREEVEEEEEEELSFEELGLDPRLTRALLKKGIQKPTPIQRVAIPLVLVSFSVPEFINFLFGFRENMEEKWIK